MNNENLALFGGHKMIEKTFLPHNPIGDEEINSVVNVMKTGVLSQFLGAWHEDFYGGGKGKEF